MCSLYVPPRVIFQDFPCIAVAGLGKEEILQDEVEGLDVKKENVRLGVSGVLMSFFCRSIPFAVEL